MSAWARRVGAVLGGFFATALLSVGTDTVMHATGLFPPWDVRMSDGLFGVAATYRAAYTVVGGWVTARLAADRPMHHAWALAGLGTLGGVGGLVAWSQGGEAMGPLWYAVSILVSAVPCIVLGGWLASRGARAGA